MKFQEITEKEYRDFWENHPLKTFLSAPEISKLRQKSNWDTYYVGVKEKKKNLLDMIGQLWYSTMAIKGGPLSRGGLMGCLPVSQIVKNAYKLGGKYPWISSKN